MKCFPSLQKYNYKIYSNLTEEDEDGKQEQVSDSRVIPFS